jgi:hypothetical protein
VAGWRLGALGDCRAAGHRVLAAAEAAGEQAAVGWTHALLGFCATIIGANDEARAHLARALDHFRRAGDLSGQANAHILAAPLAAPDGDWARARLCVDERPAARIVFEL